MQSCDGDWVVLGPENPLSTFVQAEAVAQSTSRQLVPLPVPGSFLPPSSVVPAAGTAPFPVLEEAAVRRTTRSTAGHHTNIHRLPQPTRGAERGGVNPPGPVSLAVAVLFRPWS